MLHGKRTKHQLDSKVQRTWSIKRLIKISCNNFSSATTSSQEGATSVNFINAMRKVPSPVVVVTSSNGLIQRGITCSSFTSVSRTPPIVSFCINKPSRMHNLLMETKSFIINVLSEKQIHHSIHFSKQTMENEINQFENIPYTLSDKGHPILPHCNATLHCTSHSVHSIGDHHVWYGNVHDVSYANLTDIPPLLYYARTYHSVGDATFMNSFETATLAYEDWTHEAHLRMAWNYIHEFGREKAIPLIKEGIQHFNERNSDKVQRGYHETITMFFIHMICCALNTSILHSNFQDFLNSNPHLRDSSLLFKYYSQELLNTNEAKQRWAEPDLAKLP